MNIYLTLPDGLELDQKPTPSVVMLLFLMNSNVLRFEFIHL
jgi:hypothetical protein